MDPLSILTTIPELIERAESAYNFVKKFKAANESCLKLMADLKSFDEALSDLQSVVAMIQDSGPHPDQLRVLSRFERNIKNCSKTLCAICLKFDHNKLERWWNRFLWAYKDEQEVHIFQRELEHHKSQFLVDLGLFISKDIKVIRSGMEKMDLGEKRKDLINWLKPIDTNTKHQMLRDRRQDGTCGWLLASSQFTSWCSSPGSIFWLSGIPGAGKSVLVAFVIDSLRALKSPHEIVISFFCDFRINASTDPVTILRTLLVQLLRHYPWSYLDQALQDLILQSDEQGAPSSLPALVNLLHQACSGWTRVYIVMDALDECDPDKREELLRMIARLPLDNDRIYLFVSSRREQDIVEIFHSVDNVVSAVFLSDHTQSVGADIARHVSAQINGRRRLARLSLENKFNIQSILTEKAEGMFRWADCQLDVIERVISKNGIECIDETLQNLPTGLFPTYERILEAIEHMGPGASEVAQRALRWLVGAPRPLLLPELVEAVMLEPGRPELNRNMHVVDPHDILEYCSSLVNYDEVHMTVSISHFSVQDFLLSKELANKADISQYSISTLSRLHQDLFTMTISYLLLNEFRLVHLTTARGMEVWLAQHPFMRYAACSWMRHLNEIDGTDGEERVFIQLQHFIFHPSHVLLHQTRRQVHHAVSPKDLEFYREKPQLSGETTPDVEIDHIILLLLHTGPVWVLRRLCEAHPKLTNRSYFDYGVPLMIVILNNSDTEMVKMLLGVGADVDKCAKHHGVMGDRPPLYFAIRFRPETEIIDVMLQHGARTNYPPSNGDNGSLILCAAKYGRTDVLRRLILQGVDVNTKSEDYTTPLHQAVMTGSFDMVRVLVEAGSDVNAKRASGMTPLLLALNQRSTEIIQYLLVHGASPGGYINLSHLTWALFQPWYPQIRDTAKVASPPSKRSKQDVIQVSTWLNNYFGLPLALGHMILDCAEYWAVISTTRKDEVVARGVDDVPYLTMAPIEPGQIVRKIVFTVVSHDQGWGGEDTGQGIYHGSNTWFEAGTSNRSHPRREIQRNVCADPESRSHTNVWNYHDATVKPWLEGLHQGDTVGVYPRARYAGWSNHVQSIEVIMYLACKVPNAILFGKQ